MLLEHSSSLCFVMAGWQGRQQCAGTAGRRACRPATAARVCQPQGLHALQTLWYTTRSVKRHTFCTCVCSRTFCRSDVAPGAAVPVQHACDYCAGHDGQRQSKVPKHSQRNPCADCPQTEDGICVEIVPLPELCCCRFCRTAEARLVARVRHAEDTEAACTRASLRSLKHVSAHHLLSRNRTASVSAHSERLVWCR